MNKKNYFWDKDIDGEIYKSHITDYLDKIRSGLFLALFFISISELIMYLIIKSGTFDFSINNIFIKQRWTTGSHNIGIHLLIQNIINWIVFCLYILIYKKVNFSGKKTLACATFLVITTIYAFGHWGYIFLSIIYTLPIIFTCPLGKKYRLSVLIISLIMTIVYGFYHNALVESGYHILIAIVSLTAIAATYFISSCIYHSIGKAMHDISEYTELSHELYYEIAHDFVTGAFSKVALHKDMTENNNFQSIAFIDLDDFKEINDTMGHSVGDSILQTLVKCFKKKNENIYRYGGDEFIVLSKLNVTELGKKIETIKSNYIDSCMKLFNCNSTFSAGIMTMKKTETLDDVEKILNKSDKVMYVAKHNGKNQISISA